MAATTDVSLRLYLEAVDQVTSVVDRVNASLERMSQLARGVTEAAGKADQSLRAVGSASANVQAVTSSMARAEKQVASAGTQMRAFGTAGYQAAMDLQWAGLSVAAFGYGVERAFAAAVNATAQFDQQMRNVQSITHFSEAAFKQMSDAVVRLSMQLPQSATDLAEGLYQIFSSAPAAGYTNAQALDLLRVAAQGAAAGLASTGDAVTALTGVLNAFHLPVSEAQRVMDMMFQTVNRGVITFPQLTQYLGQVTESAAAAGVPLEQMFAAITTLTRAGIQPAEAVTALNRAILTFLKPSSEAIKTARELARQHGMLNFELSSTYLQSRGLVGALTDLERITQGNENLLAKIVPDVRGFKAALALTGAGAKDYAADVQAMAKSQGAAAAAFTEQSKGFQEQWEKFRNVLFTLQRTVATTLMPVLTQLMGWVQRAIEWLNGLNPTISRTLILFTALAGAAALVLGPLMMLLGTMIQIRVGLAALAGMRLGGGMLAGLLGGAAAGRAASAAGAAGEGAAAAEAGVLGGLASRLNLRGMLGGLGGIAAALNPFRILGSVINAILHPVTTLRAAFTALAGALVRVPSGLLGIARGAAGVVGGLASAGRTVLGFVAGLITGESWVTMFSAAVRGLGLAFRFLMGPWGLLIAAIVSGVALIITHWGQIREWAQRTFGGGQGIGGLLTWLDGVWRRVWGGITTYARQVFGQLVTWLRAQWNGLVSFAREIWPQVQEIIDAVWPVVRAVILSAWTFISTYLRIVWDGIKGAAKIAWDAVVAVIRVALDVVRGVIKVALDLLTGQWGKAWDDLKAMVLAVFHDLASGIGNVLSDIGGLLASWARDIMGWVGRVIDDVRAAIGWLNSLFAAQSRAASSAAAPAPGGKPLAHAMGGIISEPSWLVSMRTGRLWGSIAEAGPEMVIPGVPGAGRRGVAAAAAPVINVYVTGNVTRSERELADRVADAIVRRYKLNMNTVY